MRGMFQSIMEYTPLFCELLFKAYCMMYSIKLGQHPHFYTNTC